jgi:uncharacterized membrane protein
MQDAQMGMVIAAVAGLLIGFVLGEVAAALGLAVLAGLLVKFQELSRLVGSQQKQIAFLNKKLTGTAETVATPAVHAEPSVQPSAARATPAPDVTSQTAPPDSAPSVAPYVNEPTASESPWVEPEVAASTSRPGTATASPAAPSTGDKLFALWATSSLGKLIARTNMITRVGIVILFLGVSFLVQYASENVSVPIELRFLGIAAAALVVFLLGWRLRHRHRDYALLLQGAAVGTWYLVTFASMKVYPIMPPSFGFLLLVGLSVFAALMSVKQDAKSLAVFGILGGFLAPVLASTGDGSHVMLFSYYAVLNAGILAIVWFKAWRALTLMGFIFTFIIGVAWGVMRYQADLFASTEPFLLLFMLFYVAVVLIFGLRKRWPPHRFIDGPILFGTPAIGFALQALLVEQFEYGMAWSALGFGLFYLGITALWWKMLTERAPLLRESLTAIGVVMLTLAVPYAFDHNVTALVWAFQGAAAIWLSARQQSNWGGLLALVVQVGAGVSWLLSTPAGEQLFINAGYASSCALAMVALWSAWILRSQPDSYWVRLLHLPVLGWGLLWWFAGGLWQMGAHLSHQQMLPAVLCFVSLSFIALQWLRMRYHWQALAPVLLALLPLAVGLILTHRYFGSHPFSSFGYIAWPLTFVTLYWLYNQRDFFCGVISKAEEPWHLVSYLTMTIVAMLEVNWQVQQHTGVDSWQLIGVGLVLLTAIGVALKTRLWPAHLDPLYRHSAVAILFVMLLVSTLIGCFIQPVVDPLPYWPLLNPLDLWQIGVLVCAGLWWRRVRHALPSAIPPESVMWLLAGLGFIYLNTLLLRTVHAFTGVEFHIEHMLRVDLVQTCLSVLWTLLGVGLLVAANRLLKRDLWMVGMALIAIVVVKLLLVDLSNSGTIERIVSFIVVGLLLLGVGYLVPLPEKQDDVENSRGRATV